MCSGSNVPKETLVKTVESNLLEHRVRHDRVHGRRGSAAPPRKPGLTAVANTAAPHQAFDGGRTYALLAQQRERSDPEEILEGRAAEIDANTMKDASGMAEEASPAPGYNDGLDDSALPETELMAEECATPAYHDIGRFHCRRSCRSRCWRPCRFHCRRPCRIHCRRPFRFHCRRPCLLHC